MSNLVRDHIRSNVVGYFAVFLTLTMGTAFATHPGGADTISTDDIINGQVRTADLGNQQVRSADLQNDGITGADVADTDSLGSPEVGGLAGGDVADDGLAGADIDEASLDSSVLQRRVSGSCEGDKAIRAIDATGTALDCVAVGEPTGPAGGDLAGTYPDPSLAADAVGSAEVAAESLAAVDLAPGSVGASEVADNSLFSGDLGIDSVTSAEVAASAVGSSEILDNNVTQSDIGIEAVGNIEIEDGTVGTLEVGPLNTLTTADIDDDSLTGVGSALALENGADDLTPGELGEINLANFPTCDPAGAFISCGTVTSSPTAAAQILLLGSGGFVGTASGADTGTCKIMEGTTQIGADVSIGQTGSEHSSAATADGFMISAVAIVSAGSHTYQLQCNQTAGNVQIREARLAAVFLI